MKKTPLVEDSVVSAVRAFASLMGTEGKADAVSLLVDATSRIPLSGLDYWERRIRSEYFAALRHATPKWPGFRASPPGGWNWLDLVSGDGREREAALRSISGAAPNAFFFSVALRRLNDWVPQVRKAARRKLPEIADATDPTFVVDALCVVLLHWTTWGRIAEEEVTVLRNIIGEDRIAVSLVAKLISSPVGPMPSVFAQLGRTPVLDDHLERIAGSAVQPAVRAKAYRCLFEGRITWTEGRKWEWTDIRYCEGRLKAVISERKVTSPIPLHDLLARSAEDPSFIVRNVSAEFLIRNLELLGQRAQGLAERFASDHSRRVRERGVFVLKWLGESK